MRLNELVSVIIPAYNAESTIEKTVRSILNQTYKNIEILIINDGSLDNTQLLISDLARLHNQIRIFQQKNKGAAAARNLGIRESSGIYIQFMDSDDILSKDKIDNQVKKLENSNFELIYCNSLVFRADNDLKNSFLQPVNDFSPCKEEIRSHDLILELYGRDDIFMIQPNAFLITKTLLNRVGLWNEELTLDDDGEFFTRVIMNTEVVLFDNISINYYRIFDSNSLSHGSDYKAFISAKKSLISKLMTFENNLNNSDRFLVSRNLISVFYYSYYLKYRNEENFSEIKKLLKNFGGFNNQFWPRRISRIASKIMGFELLFKIKSWVS